MNSKSFSAICPRLSRVLLCLVVLLTLQAVAAAQGDISNTEYNTSAAAVDPCDHLPQPECIMGPEGCMTIRCPYPAQTPTPLPTPRPSPDPCSIMTPLEFCTTGPNSVCVIIPCDRPIPTATPLPSPVPTPNLFGWPPSRGMILISEYRLRGPGGVNDEFVELYNNSDYQISVATSDKSAGWALVASDGVVRFIVPSGTIIPARGHYLGVNSLGYSLGTNAYPASSSTWATGDSSYILDIPDGAGLALYSTSNPANFAYGTLVDSVGSNTSGYLYSEGGGYASYGAETFANLNYSFYRDLSANGYPKDTNNNSADFFGVDPNRYNTSLGQHLGAPGPENLSSPTYGPGNAVQVSLIDPAVSSSVAPNRVRDTTPNPYNHSTYGTLTFNRTITNVSGSNITRLRFRIIDITTWPSQGGYADLRVINGYGPVTLTNGSTVYPWSTYLENPDDQPNGGGYNSTVVVGGISPYYPLRPGQSIYVKFTTGVEQSGTFRYFIIPEVRLNEPAPEQIK